MSEPLPLAGRHALAVGAAQPLARSVAVALAEAGARVSIGVVSDERSEEIAAHSILNECWTLGRDGQVIRIDVRARDAAVESLRTLAAEVASVDLVVMLVDHQAVAQALASTAPETRLVVVTESAEPAQLRELLVGALG